MTISGMSEMTVIVHKSATVQSTVVTKTCWSLLSCSTVHDLSVLHALECDARNVVKRLAKRSRVNCLFDMLNFYGTGSNTCLGHRGLSGTKKKRRPSLRAVVRNILLLSSVRQVGAT